MNQHSFVLTMNKQKKKACQCYSVHQAICGSTPEDDVTEMTGLLYVVMMTDMCTATAPEGDAAFIHTRPISTYYCEQAGNIRDVSM